VGKDLWSSRPRQESLESINARYRPKICGV
jgi:hypothetical protein